MSTYQQYLSLPLEHQLPPLAPMHQHLQSPILGAGETTVGGGFATPGYVSIHPPNSWSYQLRPQNYAYGFNSSGRFIGANQEIPYPSANPRYHHIPFQRLVDWSTSNVLRDPKDNVETVIKKKEGNSQKKVQSASIEPAEYFTAENDEGYNEWVAKKRQERRQQDEQQAQVRMVPKEIKALPGHAGPSTLETSNEVYGQYLDLRPKYPAVYPLPAKIPPMPLQVLVRFRNSNMSDHPRIPDHVFAVDPREMINKDGCYTRGTQGTVYYPEMPGKQRKTAYTFRQTPIILGDTAGVRSKGYTWPINSATGLELHRPISRCVSIVAGIDGKMRCRTQLPVRSVPYIYNRYISYTAPPSLDPNTEPNPARVQQKQTCAPHDPTQYVNPCQNPCSLDFINPQVLPRPVERRTSPPC